VAITIDDIPDEVWAEAIRAEMARRKRAKRVRSSITDWARACPPTLRGPMDPYGWQEDAMSYMQASVLRLTSRPHNAAKTVRVAMFGAPQQSGKSEATKVAVAFALANGLSVGVLCYNETFAREWGRDVRRLLRSRQAIAAWPHLRIPDGNDAASKRARRDQSDAATRWTVPHPQPDRPPVRFASTGRRGGLEGLPLDIVVCDDLYKTISDAQSDANVRLVNDLLTSSALGRVNEMGGEIWDIGTRRGKRDTKGFWLAQRADLEAAGLPMDIENHVYPLRGEEDWRYGDRGYITQHWDEIKERQTRRRLGRFAGPLLDQVDIDDVGGLFHHEALQHRYPESPIYAAMHADSVWLSVDAAETEGGGDWTVIQAFAIRGEFSDQIDQIRGQWNELQVMEQIGKAIRKHNASRVLVEDASSGKIANLALKRRFPQVEPVPTHGRGSKRDQIQGTMSLWLMGRVRYPEPANDPGWCYAEDENGMDLHARLLRLRGDRPDMRGEVDDEADATCQLLRYRMSGQGSPTTQDDISSILDALEQGAQSAGPW
jgi:hypothetical protein